MTSVRIGTRERILTATSILFRRQGYTGTGLKEIAVESDARIGSVYHFFDGKEALAEEVVRTGGAAYGAMVLGVLNDGSPAPVDAIGAMFTQAARDLEQSDYADACPIATVALEAASTHDTIRQATADVFAAWTDDLSSWCRAIVDDPHRSRDLAIAILTSLEGGFILARAQRSQAPLLAAGRSMTQLAQTMADAT
ncbi:TetR/AcrR family transcriptional regulator [Ruania zhangjianzhongii]|uniref:TetR/AcrR family transcriptional regulator n=1 Tax=Ruania zhangjianzhongii TaxID=2603206 RepID=UPI0016522FA7|nr:TetR/AcrR family transcriptional regulator [Ruania zhangjianzhongii]